MALDDSVQEPRYRDGARAVAPLSLGALAFGASFGVLAEAAGMGVVAPIVMSATTFAGSAQFAAASILDDGGTVAAAIAAAVLLNARYAAIAITVASLFRGPRWLRLFQAQLIVDESWAVSRRRGRYDLKLLFGAGLVLFVAWVGGTAIGVAAGDVLGDPETLGLDAAFPALFLALLVGYVKSREAAAAALLGGALALALLPLTPAGVPIIAAGLVCLIALRRG